MREGSEGARGESWEGRKRRGREKNENASYLDLVPVAVVDMSVDSKHSAQNFLCCRQEALSTI